MILSIHHFHKTDETQTKAIIDKGIANLSFSILITSEDITCPYSY